MKKRTYQLVLTAVLSALAVCGGSMFSFPIGVAKCAPTQSLINIVAGVVLGPEWAVVQALLTSTLRNLLGTGTLLAYPGSIFGAWLSGWLFKRFGKIWLAALGELIGYRFDWRAGLLSNRCFADECQGITFLIRPQLCS